MAANVPGARYVPATELVTDRLRLRRPQLADAEAVFAAYANDARVTRYVTWTAHEDVAETREYLATVARQWADGSQYVWLLEQHDTGAVVGAISACDGAHGISIGFVLGLRHWGRGLMSEAARALVADAVGQPAVYRVWATHDVDNPASGRVMANAGMVREGLLRRWLIHPNISNEPRDAVAYAWTRE